MKFKKISALVLAIAMMVSLMVVPAAAEATKYYSVTGYDVPDFLTNLYDSETIAIQDLAGNASYAPTLATHTVLDTSGNVAEYETTGAGTVDSIVDGSCVGTNGLALGIQLSWDTTRMVVLDLGSVKKVDKVDLYTGQEGTGGNKGSISSIKVYSGESGTGPWTHVTDITPGTGDGYVADNGWNRWFFQEGTLASTVETRYIAVEIAHSQNVLVNQINVLSKTDPTPKAELTTYYSLTGYDMPAFINSLYNSETTQIGSASSNINYTPIPATHYFTDLNGTSAGIYEETYGTTSALFDGSYVPADGIENGLMLSYNNSRRIVVDLGSTKAVDKVDIYTAQEGTAGGANGKINSIKVYSGTSASGPWTYVRDITPGTGDGYVATNTQKKWFFQEGTFASTVNTRYIAIDIAQSLNTYVNYVAVLSKTAPTYTPSWGNELNVISNNTNNGQIVLPGNMISDYPELSGVTVTGSQTAAKYKWLTGETTISDETTRDADGYVIPSENASYPYPDMQDGGYSDGNSKFNTTNWGTIAGSMLWDLGEEYTLSRLDILSDPAPSTYGWVAGARISISNNGADFTTVIDRYSGAVNAYDSGTTKISVYDLNGAKARYIKVEFIGDTAGKNTTVGEMYIYGNPIASATGLMFTADGTNAIESYAAGTLSAQATFNAAGGDLIVGWYDATMKELKGVYKVSGTGTKSIDLSSNDFEVGDKLKAFAFDSLSSIKSLATPAQVEVVSGE